MRKDIYYLVTIALLVAVFFQGRGHYNDLVNQSRILESALIHARQEVRDLRDHLRRMEQEAAWYSQPQVEFIGSDELESEAYFTISWTFQSLEQGMEVELDYQVAGGTWQQAEVEHVSGLTYRAHVTIPVTLETMPYTIEFSSTAGHEKPPSMEMKWKDGPALVNYNIIASDGHHIESSRESFELKQVTGFFHAVIKEDPSQEAFHINVMRRHYHSDPQWNNVATLDVIALSRALSEKTQTRLAAVADHEWHQVMEVTTQEVGRLVIVVTFQDGTVAHMPVDLPWSDD